MEELMKEITLPQDSEQMLSEQIHTAVLDAIQFGAYGAGQEIKIKVDKSEAKNREVPQISTSSNDIDNFKVFLQNNQEMAILHSNRVEWAIESAQRFSDSYKAWLNLASSYLNGGDLVEASKAIDKALLLAPNETPVKAMQGRLRIMEGNIKDAIVIYREILNKETNIAARETVALLELSIGHVDIAIEELLQCLEAEPQKRASVYYNLGIAFLVKNKCGRAISYFRKALQTDSEYLVSYTGIGIAYLLLGYMKKSEVMFRIASERGLNDIESKLNLSRIFALQKKWNDVVSVLGDLIQQFPNSWRAREDLGIAYVQLGRFQEATVQFYKVLDAIKSGTLIGNLSNGLNNLGVSYFLRRNDAKAEELFKLSILESNHKNVYALMNLTRLYLRNYKTEKVEIMLDELKGFLGYDEEIAVLKAMSHYEKQEYPEAVNETTNIISQIPQGVNLTPSQISAICILSDILNDEYDNYSAAEKILWDGYKKAKDNPHILNNLGYTLILQGKTKEAEIFLDKINESKDLIFFISLATRGLLHIRNGELDTGAAFYNHAASLVSDKDFSNQMLQKKELELGRWYLNHGETEKGRAHLEKAMEFTVNDKIYRRKASVLLES